MCSPCKVIFSLLSMYGITPFIAQSVILLTSTPCYTVMQACLHQTNTHTTCLCVALSHWYCMIKLLILVSHRLVATSPCLVLVCAVCLLIPAAWWRPPAAHSAQICWRLARLPGTMGRPAVRPSSTPTVPLKTSCA